MVKRQIDHGIHGRRSAVQTLQILNVAAMNFRTSCFQFLCAAIATRETANRMPRVGQFLDEFRPNKPCRSCYKMRMILILDSLYGAS